MIFDKLKKNEFLNILQHFKIFKNMILIGLCGKIGVGKDFIAKKLSNYLIKHRTSNVILSFADQLKINSMIGFEKTFEECFVSKTQSSRKFLQTYGTSCREEWGENIWIEYLEAWIKVLSMRNVKIVIISDVRYKNEFDFIKSQNGMLIKINSDLRNFSKIFEETNGDSVKIKEIQQHVSETNMDNFPDEMYDILVDNNDIIFNKMSAKILNYK